jgi:hypothetical protein
VAELREHFASGRLNQDELDERLASAFAARTRGDLNALFTDLPSSGHGSPGAETPGWSQWTRPGASDDAYAGWQGRGNAGAGSVGRGIGRLAATSVLVWLLFIVGILGMFGIGTGRPFGVVLILAAFALLRRLLFMIFGRRRRMRGGRGRGSRRC